MNKINAIIENGALSIIFQSVEVVVKVCICWSPPTSERSAITEIGGHMQCSLYSGAPGIELNLIRSQVQLWAQALA